MPDVANACAAAIHWPHASRDALRDERVGRGAMSKREILIVGRLFFGLLTLVAIIAQFAIHLQHGFDVGNFFGYFTNLSNIFASVVFIIGAVYLMQNREPTVNEDLVRGASVVAMAI